MVRYLLYGTYRCIRSTRCLILCTNLFKPGSINSTSASACRVGSGGDRICIGSDDGESTGAAAAVLSTTNIESEHHHHPLPAQQLHERQPQQQQPTSTALAAPAASTAPPAPTSAGVRAGQRSMFEFTRCATAFPLVVVLACAHAARVLVAFVDSQSSSCCVCLTVWGQIFRPRCFARA